MDGLKVDREEVDEKVEAREEAKGEETDGPHGSLEGNARWDWSCVRVIRENKIVYTYLLHHRPCMLGQQ